MVIGFLVGVFLSVLAGYSLRLAVRCDLLARDEVEPYFARLVERDGAKKSRIFASLG